MRVSIRSWVAVALLGTLVAACGDKSSDPDAVTVDELKYPGNLVVLDKGDGVVSLSWTGTNNEDGFDGYNVYGVKGEPDKLGVTEHKAIELLDDKGDKVPAATTTLGNFNYDPEKKLGLAAPLALADSAAATKEEPEFSALPIFRKSGEDRLLPTCKAHGAVCTMTTAADKDTTVKSNPNYAVNGRVTFDVPDTLMVGEKYCFFVMASMNNGEKVSQTSSNVECVVPKYKLAFDLALPGSKAENKLFDLRKILEDCKTDTKCTGTKAAANVTVAPDSANAGSRDHVAKDPGPVYVEKSNSGALGFVAGLGTAINDIGYYAQGLDDPSLPKTVQPLVLNDSKPIGSGANSEAPIFNGGGYSVGGQTVPLQANHVYIIAVGAQTASGVGPFNYHWLAVGSDVSNSATSIKVDMRLTKGAL